MANEQEICRVNPRQFFSACLHILGEDKLSKIWGVSQRQLYRFAADPMHCEDWVFNPVERMMETVKELKIYGRVDIAAHGIRFLASTIGWTLQQPEQEERDVHHMDALRRVTDFLEAHARGDDYMELSDLREKAVASLESLWIQRRAECVSFCVRSSEDEEPKGQHKWSWWPWGKG